MNEVPKATLRIIDANLNRTGEGLRVIEEFARLTLDDAALTQQLKNLRHGLVKVDSRFQTQLLGARDSESDIGAAMDVPGEAKTKVVSETIAANARRVQEALRVLEEVAKVAGLDSEKFRQARFALYAIEKNLMSRLLRQDKRQRLRGLYVVVDTAFLRGRRHVEVTARAIRGGAKAIQLRDKTLPKKELLAVAQPMRNLCAEAGVLFIVNDYLDIALAVDADGLHVGQDDLPVEVARRLLPVDKILGCSVNTVAGALAARDAGADYLGVGAMYSTPSKEDIFVVGPDRLQEIKQAVSLPLVAIGGINKDNIGEVLAAGAAAVAVIGAVLGAEDVTGAARRMAERIEK